MMFKIAVAGAIAVAVGMTGGVEAHSSLTEPPSITRSKSCKKAPNKGWYVSGWERGARRERWNARRREWGMTEGEMRRAGGSEVPLGGIADVRG